MDVSDMLKVEIGESKQSLPSTHKSSVLQISDYVDCIDVDDRTKMLLIENNKPPPGFKFPPKEYRDKRRASGMIKRYCREEWFRDFNFISYSVRHDGLYCNTCVLFHTEHSRPNMDRVNMLVTKPYRNWTDAKSDLKTHSVTEAHNLATAKKEAFIRTYNQPAARIDNIMAVCTKAVIEKNRTFLTSILKCVELCGRNGLALRGHRDDATNIDKTHQGNFKNLLDFRIDAGDITLKEHLETSRKNASYIPKTTQNQLLDCVKEYVEAVIISEI